MYLGTHVHNHKYEGPGYGIEQQAPSDDAVRFEFTPLGKAQTE